MLSPWVYDPEPKTPTRKQGRPLGEIVKEKIKEAVEAVGDAVAPAPETVNGV